MKSSRGDKGIKAADIINVLGLAGWEARPGHGDHTVLSKQGQQQIVLADTITMAQWKNIERSVGVQIETLLRKKRGRGVEEEEMRKRLSLAKILAGAGFPLTFVARHSGITTSALHGFSLGSLKKMPVEDIMRVHYVGKGGEVAAEEEVPEPAEEAQVLAMPTLPAPPHDDLSAILELLQDVVQEVRGLKTQRSDANHAFLRAFRRASDMQRGIREDFEKLLNEMAAAWNEEAHAE